MDRQVVRILNDFRYFSNPTPNSECFIMNVISPDTGSKKMNKNILIVLGGAIIAAVLVAVLVQVTLGGKKTSTLPDGEGVEVLVAAKALRTGDELEEGDLRWQKWPEDNLYKGVITRKDSDESADDVLKGRLERSFTEGEAVVRKALLKESKANYVAARLQQGERAVTIKVSAEAMVAGFISPGSFVDVILTYNQRVSLGKNVPPKVQMMVEMNLDKLATETILENVRVLAIDQKADQDKEDKIKVGKTVTLAVPIRDAEKLALAAEMGEITLAMRGVGDDKPNEKGKAMSDARLTTIGDEIVEEYMIMKKESGVASNTLKIYNGAQVQTIPVP